jgi:hypothetical protein
MGAPAAKRDEAKKRKLTISTNSENHRIAGLVINKWDECGYMVTNPPGVVTSGLSGVCNLCGRVSWSIEIGIVQRAGR